MIAARRRLLAARASKWKLLAGRRLSPFQVALLLLLVHSAGANQQQTSRLELGSADPTAELDNSIALQTDVNSRQANNAIASPKETSERQQAALERRIDLLEFELRKLMHLARGSSQPSSASASAANSAAGASSSDPSSSLGDLSALVNRLELMEKFIATTTAKLYETEQRVRQLEKCECRLSCKWKPPEGPKTVTTTTMSDRDSASESVNEAENGTGSAQGHGGKEEVKQQLNESLLLSKADGEVWKSKCDVCSCHRGHVRCKHLSCPELSCADPQYEAGKCCPFCYKSCVFKGQTLKHGHKLVINSNREQCKECLCVDGRLKCQRVDLEPHSRRLLRRSIDVFASPDTDGLVGARSNHSQADNNDTDYNYNGISAEGEDDYYLNDDNEDEADEKEPQDGNGQERASRWSSRRERRSESSSFKRGANGNEAHPALVCPQIDCKLEEQFRLENDCCTYCRGMDFCSLVSQKRLPNRCHPSAHCLPLQIPAFTSASASAPTLVQPDAAALNETTATSGHSQSSSSVLTLKGSLFACRCGQGFEGDGRHCRDINECSQRRLNSCDPKTSYCVNSLGSYQCRCRPGFRSAALLDYESSNDNNATMTCVDINECNDGKLNRCHPQAKCVNLRGSYKCLCKRGFLGNGFECHQWFSSDQNVAAYLLRHQPSTATNKKREETTNNTSSSSLANDKWQLHKPNLKPLGSLEDPDSDEDNDEDDIQLQPATGGRTSEMGGIEADEEEATESRDEPETEEDEERESNGALEVVPKWEPLLRSFELQLHPQQARWMDNSKPIRAPDNQKWQPEQMALQSAAPTLNTRTMLFQPPPRFWQENVTTSSRIPPEGGNQTTDSTTNYNHPDRRQHNGLANSAAKSDTNDPVYIQRSSPESSSSSPIYHDWPPRQTASLNNGGFDHQSYNNRGQQTTTTTTATTTTTTTTTTGATTSTSITRPGPLTAALPNINTNNGPSHKRGTIIASATTSPNRGHNGRMASFQSSQHYRSRALGGTSAATSIDSRASLRRLLANNIDEQISQRFFHHMMDYGSLMLMMMMMISLLHNYCIHLNHVVTFYFT